jgi:hypothetical protein
LNEEGEEEGAAAESADATHDDGEDHGAGEEGGDGDEGLEPAPWFTGGLVGGAETKEDGVSCRSSLVRVSCLVYVTGEGEIDSSHTSLHAQETGPGIVCAAIAETRQEAEYQTHQVRVGRVQSLPPSSREG